MISPTIPQTDTHPSKTRSNKSKALLLFALALAGIFYSAQTVSVTIHTVAGSPPAFDYLTIILMENNGLCDITPSLVSGCGSSAIPAPYLTTLAQTYGFNTHYTGISHPSEPNYCALFGGEYANCANGSDGVCCFQDPGPNILDRLESAGLTWKAFAEDSSASGTCSFMPPRAGDHYPFIDFQDMNTTSRCANFLTTSSPNDTEFINVLNGPNPPNFLWLTPNDQDNMHSSSVMVGDSYLASLVPKILGSTTFTTKNAALLIIFDEGGDTCPSSPTGDCVYATWAGPVVKHNFASNAQYNHYSFLKTLETVWGMSSLTPSDSGASPMTEFFQANPQQSGPSSNPASRSSASNWFWFAVPIMPVAALGLVLGFTVRSRRERTHATVQH